MEAEKGGNGSFDVFGIAFPFKQDHDDCYEDEQGILESPTGKDILYMFFAYGA